MDPTPRVVPLEDCPLGSLVEITLKGIDVSNFYKGQKLWKGQAVIAEKSAYLVTLGWSESMTRHPFSSRWRPSRFGCDLGLYVSDRLRAKMIMGDPLWIRLLSNE